jgi:hypothetical protein
MCWPGLGVLKGTMVARGYNIYIFMNFGFRGEYGKVRYRRFPQLKLRRLPPFLSKLGKRGGLWTSPKVRGTRAGCRLRGESSQWSSNPLQTSRIVPA